MKQFYSLLFLLCSFAISGMAAPAGVTPGVGGGINFQSPGKGCVVGQEAAGKRCSKACMGKLTRLFALSSASQCVLYTWNTNTYTDNSPSGKVPGTGCLIASIDAVDYCVHPVC